MSLAEQKSKPLEIPAGFVAFRQGGIDYTVNASGAVLEDACDLAGNRYWKKHEHEAAACALYKRIEWRVSMACAAAEPLMKHDCDAQAAATFELQSLRRWMEAGCGGCASVDNILGEIDARTAAAAKGAGIRARITAGEPVGLDRAREALESAVEIAHSFKEDGHGTGMAPAAIAEMYARVSIALSALKSSDEPGS